MKYKAILCDVDGTLIPNKPDGMPSEKVCQAVEKAESSIHISVATSRPYWMVQPILHVLQIVGPCIVNGATQLVESPSGKILWEIVMTKKSFKKAIDIILSVTQRFF